MHMTLERWCEVQSQQNPQFDYWLKILSLEIILLLYIRAIGEGNFQLYIAIKNYPMDVCIKSHALLEMTTSSHSGHAVTF